MQRVLLTPDPQDSCWDLYPRAVDGKRALLGWVSGTQAVDAGVPAAVATFLSKALCGRFTLTFLRHFANLPAHPKQWQAFGASSVKHCRAGLLDRMLGNPSFTLSATHDPLAAECLFYDEKFSWELRAQRVFLSALGVLPYLEYRHVRDIFNWSRPMNVISLLQNTQVLGLMLPGVDGDFVEFCLFEERHWQSLQDALAQECATSGVEFQLVDAATFKHTRWFTDGA